MNFIFVSTVEVIMEKVSEQEFDELLAEEADMTVEELYEQGSVGLTPPWESEIIADHEDR